MVASLAREDNALRVCLRVFGAVVSRNGTTLSIRSRVSVPPRPSPSCLHHFYLHRRPVLLPFSTPVSPLHLHHPSRLLSVSPAHLTTHVFPLSPLPVVHLRSVIQLLMKIRKARTRSLLTHIARIYSFFRRRQRSHMQCGSVELELCAESRTRQHR